MASAPFADDPRSAAAPLIVAIAAGAPGAGIILFLTGSLMDYALPRSDDVPSFDVATKETPCTHNVLGVKGCGEAGAIGAPAAVMNAITVALWPLGIREIPMPATPQTVWRAVRSAPQGRSARS